jgi:lysophospholipase L1-like esterase
MNLPAGTRTTPSLPRGRVFLFQAATAVLILLLLEIGLRVAGFEYHNIPRYIQFAGDTYKNQGLREGRADFVPDKQVFWRLAPNDPRLLTNSRGYRGAEFAPSKSPGVTRIISLGCSCTFGIESAYCYPLALEQFLNRNSPGKRYEVLNAGVPGYSSFQGARLLEVELVSYQPDLITIYFGWNDHWLARHFQDKDQRTPSRAAQFLLDHASGSRIVQACLRLSASLGGRGESRSTSTPCRVSLDDYRQNLERMVDDAGRCGARVALLTAPTAFTDPSDVPDYLVAEGFATDKPSVIRLHREYNEVVREVARSRGALLIDCAAGFDGSPRKKILFGEDGIHPDELGHWLIAAKMIRGFVRQGWIDRGDYSAEELESVGLDARGGQPAD